MYAYKKNSRWVFPVNLKSKHNGIRGWHLLSDIERAEHDWYPLIIINDTPPYGKVKGTFPFIVLTDNIVTVTYQLIDIDISTLRAAKEAEIKDKFNADSLSPVAFLGSSFKGGQKSAETADGKARLVIRTGENAGGAQPFTTTFNDVDGAKVTLDTNQLQDLAVTIGAQYEDTFQKKAQLVRDLKLTTLSDINNFNVDLLWGAA